MECAILVIWTMDLLHQLELFVFEKMRHRQEAKQENKDLHILISSRGVVEAEKTSIAKFSIALP